MKLKILMIAIMVAMWFPATIAAQSVKSNPVCTKVGSPDGESPCVGGAPGEGKGPNLPTSSDVVITCPLSQDGSGGFNITCGSSASRSSNGCGHGEPPSYPFCQAPPYAVCPYSSQLKAAIDVRPAGSDGGNSPVFLPYVDGNKSVEWTLVSGPISINGGAWGQKLEYTASLEGKNYRIDLTHLDPAIDKGARNSGDKVGKTKAGVDAGNGGHLHVAVSVNGKWLDAIGEGKVCTSK